MATKRNKPAAPTPVVAQKIYAALEALYPDAHCALNHRNAFELIIATILSAQCTDVRVNMATPGLFKKYPTSRAMADADIADLEHEVRSTGLFRNKAKNIKAASAIIADKHAGDVPQTMDE